MRRLPSLYGEAPGYSPKKGVARSRPIPFLWWWMQFRLWLPVTAPLSAVAAGVACAVVHPHPTPDKLLLYSGCLSLAWTLLVLMSYKHIVPWRRHPSYLLLQRSVNSLVFTIVILAKELSVTNSTCDAQYKAGVLQFSLLAGELWMAALSLDLYLSLTDPFLGYATNQRRYTVGVYSVALLSSLCLAGGVGSSCLGTFETNAGISLCWIENDQFGACFALYFLAWVVAFYLFSLGVGVFAFSRLSNGLSETYSTRRAVVTTTFRIVLAYLCYGLFLSALYLATTRGRGSELFAFFVGLRGWYDSCIWFALHNFKTNTTLFSLLCGGGVVHTAKRASDAALQERRTPLIDSGIGREREQQIATRETRASRVSFAAILLDTDIFPSSSADGAHEADIDDDDDDLAGPNQFAARDGKDLSEFGQDDVDLTPQLNLALRKEVLHLVTGGIRESVLRWDAREEEPVASSTTAAASATATATASRRPSRCRGNSSSEDGFSLDSGSRTQYFLQSLTGRSVMSTAAALLGLTRQPGEYGEDPAYCLVSPHRPGRVNSNASSTGQWRHTSMMGSHQHHHNQHHQQQDAQQAPPPPQEVVFDLDEERHRFVDFRPATFALLRDMAGFTSQRYLELMAQPAREKLTSEGGSNAFQFVCGRGEIIVKTVSHGEANVLRSRLDRYLEHLRLHPSSLLVRFLGLHTLTLFGRDFNFVVMRNVFPSSINERFDLKGSWVGRNAAALVPGSRQVCRKCSETFFQGDVSSACSVGVHGHEANVVLKDNDLQNKIRLRSEDVWNVIETLHSDSDCLASMGIMDYSLLIGIKNKQYDLNLADGSTLGGGESRQSLTPSISASVGIVGRASSSDDRASNVSTADTVVNLHSSCLGPPQRLRQILLAGAGPGGATTSSEPSDLSGALSPGDSFSRDSDFMAIPGSSQVHSGGALGSGLALLEGFLARSVVAPERYHLGIVDILQDWSWQKRLEHVVRVFIRRQPPEGISCIPPEPYKTRFQAKISRTFDHALFVRQVTGAWSGSRFLGEPEPLHQA